MAIGSAVQRGSLIYVYDEKGRRLTSLLAGKGLKDGLQGYTSSTVSVRQQLVDLYVRRKRPAVEFDIGGAMTTTVVKQGDLLVPLGDRAQSWLLWMFSVDVGSGIDVIACVGSGRVGAWPHIVGRTSPIFIGGTSAAVLGRGFPVPSFMLAYFAMP
jgi:hypothetical protein